MSRAGFAGALQERVTIEHWQDSTDELAGDPGAWVTVEDGWASIRPEPARAGLDGDAISVRKRYRIEMRDMAGLGLRHRLVWNGAALVLLSIDRDPAMPDRLRILAEVRP